MSELEESNRGLAIIAVAWLAAGLGLLFLLGPLLYRLTAFVMLPVGAAYACVGLGVLAVGAVRARRARGVARRRALGALLAVPTFAAAAFFLGGYAARTGDALVFRASFARLRPQYERIAQAAGRRALAATGATRGGYGVRDGTTYVLDVGPPWRVAFPRPGGLLDNWEGVIYDPTDAVRAARGWSFASGRQEFTAPPAVRALFGGDIVTCEHVTGHFYRCWFT